MGGQRKRKVRNNTMKKVLCVLLALCMLLSVCGGSITGAQAVNKSLPDFFERIQKLGVGVTYDELDK